MPSGPCNWHRQIVLVAAAAASVFLCGCRNSPLSLKPPSVPKQKLSFAEVASAARVGFRYEHHPEADYRSILESLGGGAAFMDYDADGHLDLCFPGGGMFGAEKTVRGVMMGLFRNRGNWQFEAVTTDAFADRPRHYSHGAAAADYNRDGFVDVLITGYGGLQLWRNQGDGTFMEVQSAAGLSDRLWSTSAGWGDINGDGELDLYVVHYVNWSFDNHPACPSPQDPGQRDICSPREFEALPDTLYLSSGDGTFRDASQECGLREDGKGLGVVLADLDGDRDLDIYVANDTTANFLYLNDGRGRLTEAGHEHGTAASAAGSMDGSMGVDVCDFNRDGRPDLWVANFDGEEFALYRNLGEGRFEHSSRPAGISAVGMAQVAFGTQCGDLDLDGDEDILVANGHTSLFPTGSPRWQLPLLLEFENGVFRRSRAMGNYLARPHVGRGLALGDLDGDGDLDAAISHLEEPAALLRNDLTADHRWLALRLIGIRSPREPIGARVVLHTDGGQRHAWLCGGRSYLSTPENLIRFGIPAEEMVRRVTIHWPSGTDQQLDAPNVNRVLTVLEPTAQETAP
jgi:hypothetical protein